MRVGARIAAAMMFLGTVAPVVSAQAQQDVPGRIPVIVALVEEKLYDADAVIVRHPGRDSANIIVLAREGGTAERLAAAAMALSTVMEAQGDVATHETLLRLPGEVASSRSEQKAAERVLRRLLSAPEVNVPGVGKARTVVVYLPDAGERKRLQKIGKVHFKKGARPVSP